MILVEEGEWAENWIKPGMRAHALWCRDVRILRQRYPSQHSTQEGFDHSTADLKLCICLALITGNDMKEMDRLFRLSGLMRDKWKIRSDYRSNTIKQALEIAL